MKKILKRSISVFTAICIVFGMFIAMNNGIEADAADTYKNWTYATAGLEDGSTMSADVAPLLNEENFELDGSKFSGYINFKESGVSDVAATWSPSRLVFGNKAGDTWGEHAIRFGLREIDGEGTFLSCGTTNDHTWLFRDKTIQADEEIFLQVAFDYVDKDGDNVENDLQLHVWIDGEPATSVEEAWGNWTGVSGEDIWLEDYLDTQNPVMANVMFTADNIPMEYRSVNEVTLSGIENNKTYCGATEISIATSAADGQYEKDLASVTVNGTPVTFTQGKYTIPAGTGATTIVVTDKMDNTTTYNITVNADHTWGAELVSNNDATCLADGTKSKQCSVCQTKDADKVADVGSKIEHKFETYVSDGDATCAEDGHETAYCKYNCGTPDQRVATGSATGNHTYGTDDKCTECGADKPVTPPQGGSTGGTTGGATTGGVAPGGTTDSVDTGDHNAIWTLIALMAVSVVATAIVVLKRKELE